MQNKIPIWHPILGEAKDIVALDPTLYVKSSTRAHQRNPAVLSYGHLVVGKGRVEWCMMLQCGMSRGCHSAVAQAIWPDFKTLSQRDAGKAHCLNLNK